MTSAQNTAGAGTDTLFFVQNAIGSSHDDTLNGSSGSNNLDGGDGHDSLYGGAGNDTMIGGAGNDTLFGSLGNDSMIGGTGNDVFIVDSITDTVIEAAGGGADFVSTSVNYALGAGQEIELLRVSTTFTGGLALTGNELTNSLLGGVGADTLNGGLGADAHTGGGGNDVFVFDAVAFAAGVQDTITDFGAIAGSNFDTLRLQGSSSAYSFADISGGVLVTHTASGGTIRLLGAGQTASTLAGQTEYF